MGILDWFKNRPSQFETDRRSDEMTLRAVEKAITLINPQLKLLKSCHERLIPAVETSVRYLREMVLDLPAPIQVSSSAWSAQADLRAFFVAASDIQSVLGRSNNLRTLFEKYPSLDEACFILVMTFNEQRVLGMSLQGDMVQRDVAQTVVGFSEHQARICGLEDVEVRRLLGTQAFEYLVAQALSEIGEERAERRELQEERALIRARLRLLQQQGPGLGSVFGAAPVISGEQKKLETQLLENERQMEAMGDLQSVLEAELQSLCSVLEKPEAYVRVEQKRLRISTMNVILDEKSTDVASNIDFSVAQLMGKPLIQRAFVLARFSRSELPTARMDFDHAARYL